MRGLHSIAWALLSIGSSASPLQGPQLSLYPCNTTSPASSFNWAFSGSASSQTPGTFTLTSTGQCVTYNTTTTNLVVDTCDPGSDLQLFTIRPDGTFFNPSTALCWDSQYYGNQSGSVLGLYECYADQTWDDFSFNGSHISNWLMSMVFVQLRIAPQNPKTPFIIFKSQLKGQDQTQLVCFPCQQEKAASHSNAKV